MENLKSEARLQLGIELNTGHLNALERYRQELDVWNARFNLTVAREQNVRVELFDMNGRMIRTVYDGVLPAGENRLFKISGENLSSGTYFYRVSGENFATTKSVVLLSSANDVLAPGCW